MEINFTPKAPDIYQVTKAPSNKYDAVANVVGIICSTIMTIGIFGMGFYALHKTTKGDKK